MNEYVINALKEDELEKHTETVIAVLTSADWNLKKLSNPNNEARLVAVLEKPWLYYYEKRDMPRKLGHLSSENIGDIHDAAVTIAASLMSFNDLEEAKEEKKRKFEVLFHPPQVSLHTDGLDLSVKDYLFRDDLVHSLWNLLMNHRCVVLSSPPATGKSSLLQLVHLKYKFEFRYINCKSSDDAYTLLSNAGIDLIRKTFPDFDDLYVVIIDDAHEIYRCEGFWRDLVKGSNMWLPTNFKFIISATHSLRLGDSPIDLESEPRIGRKHLLLSDEDAYHLIDLTVFNISLSGSAIRYAIVKECAGIIGAIRLSVMKLCEEFTIRRSSGDESQFLQYFLSREFSLQLGRLFGVHHAPVHLSFINFLRECFMGHVPEPSMLDNVDTKTFLSFKKAGVLIPDALNRYSFASSLTRRYFFDFVFPNRGIRIPTSLHFLVKDAICAMSSINLKNSTIDANDFPKEAVFQHEFMSSLAHLLPPSCYICPELSKVFPDKKQENQDSRIEGEVDFYINGELRWGIELLILGDKITEHMNRFAQPDGKYVPLGVKDYVIVDFRLSKDGKPTNVITMEKRVSVFFRPGVFSYCTCRFGLDPQDYLLNLSS
jgi:hypothetical protein